MNEILIGLTGGHDDYRKLVADYLTVEFSFSQFSLSTPVKEHLKCVVNLNSSQLHGSLKNAALPGLGLTPQAMVDNCNSSFKEYFGNHIFLDLLGHRINMLRSRLMAGRVGVDGEDAYFNVVISDIESNCDADWIRAKGGVVLHIFDASVKDDLHCDFNAGVALHRDDYQIAHRGLVDELYHKVEGVVLVCLGCDIPNDLMPSAEAG